MDRRGILHGLGDDFSAQLTPKQLDDFILAFETAFVDRKSRQGRCDALIGLIVLMSKYGIPSDTLDVKSRIETFLAHNFRYADRYRLEKPQVREKMRAPDLDLNKAEELMMLAGFTRDYFRTKHGISSLNELK